MLTTFNEADMSRVLALREKHGDNFLARHGVKLGFMPFFVRACIEALEEFPAVNARIDGDHIVYQHFSGPARRAPSRRRRQCRCRKNAGRRCRHRRCGH